MFTSLSIKDFLVLAQKHPVIDVRAPLEFKKGHIPGAYSIPLFSDDQRAVVGTLYKQKGKPEAIRVGLELVGPQLTQYIEQAHTICTATRSNILLVYCARGGMRSKSFCMLLATCGYTVYQLIDGYKGFKQHLRTQAEKPYTIILLGGKTGCGKTALLQELKQQGEQIIDLENLAHHKGSVFGGIHQPEQPTQEQFIVNCLSALITCDPKKSIWIEKESYKIGNLSIPSQLWNLMSTAPVVYIDIPRAQRLENSIAEYGTTTCETLKTCVQALVKKLGGARTQKLCAELDAGNVAAVATALLDYYDQTYTFNLEKNKNTQVKHVTFMHETRAEQASKLKQHVY